MCFKLLKCNFVVKEVKYLGYVILKDGIFVDMLKVEVVKFFLKLKNIIDIRVFLGFVNYYCKFIYGFVDIVIFFNRLLVKGIKFCWDELC